MIRIAAIVIALLASRVVAQEIRVAPGVVELTGPNASQQLSVVRVQGDKAVADVSGRARFSSSNPKVAIVDAQGIVRAVGDGEATVTATFGSITGTAHIKAIKTAESLAPNFRIHVVPVLTRLGCNSGACHGALAGKGGFKLSLRGYSPEDDHFVLTRQALSRRVNRQEPSKSLMLLKPTLSLPHGGGLKLEVDSPEFRLLADWIASGAPGLSPTDPKLTRLEVVPPEATLKLKDQLQIVVRGWYSDGHAEDVTRWAKFTSSEDLVATVDERGGVKVGGHGEAAINVLFGSAVVSARVAVPFPNEVPADVFASAPRTSFVDDLVLKKLAQLRIPPSAVCSDREFIRRVFLDCIGVLPKPAEVDAFLKDTRPDRRAKLIDSLLDRPEYVDYWTYKWSDLLLISSRKLPMPAMRSFSQFVRQSVADDTPWDQFARSILTAQGSNLKNGAANYFVLHKDVADLTESTTVTFLGMSLTCCRCHNHPMEKWTQDQYWSLANMFSRVAVKNGDRGGEFTIHSQPEGDALHPKRGIAMPPTPLDGKPAVGDRRLAFANWLTAPENPYFARAFVNRVWRNYMGRGLVEAEDDLRQTNPASNEELLSAVAADFVKHHYNVKHVMRLIMNSATYQRSSLPVEGNKTDDRFYSHYLIRRLPAEVVLDAYSDISKIPTAFSKITIGVTGGDAPTADYPLGMRALQIPDTQLVSQFLDAFGRPERGQTCACERQSESSVTQALHLNNGQTLNDKLRDKKSRVAEWIDEKIDNDETIRRIFALALSRPPSASELTRFRTLLAEAVAEPGATRREAIEDLVWSVLTGREFLFNR